MVHQTAARVVDVVLRLDQLFALRLLLRVVVQQQRRLLLGERLQHHHLVALDHL